MGHARPVYVETTVRADLDALWNATQDPAQHARWDLRFTPIESLDDRRFRYTTRLLPGLRINGEGTTIGENRRTSALRFASDDARALIHSGSGYWRYVPTADGVRFLTGYDYRPRWGALGVPRGRPRSGRCSVGDRLVVRPAAAVARARDPARGHPPPRPRSRAGTGGRQWPQLP